MKNPGAFISLSLTDEPAVGADELGTLVTGMTDDGQKVQVFVPEEPSEPEEDEA